MYTNSTLIANQLQRELTTEEETLLTTLIPAVDLWIDRTLNTTFIEQETATSRYFDGTGPLIDIDPCTGVTAVASVDWEDDNVATYTTGTDYLLEPVNSNVKTAIRFRGKGFYPYSLNASIMPVADFTTGRLKITAKFSEYDDGVPEDIQIMATRICSGLVNASSADSSNSEGIKKESIEGYSVEYGDSSSISSSAMSDAVVKGILESRRELLI